MAKEIKKEATESKEQVLSKTEIFLNKYKNALLIVLCVILVIGVVSFCWYKFIYQPKVVEAQGQMAVAEQNFRANDWETALEGDGNALGFSQIISEYGSKAGKSVYFYAGVCQLQLGNYAEAVKYLKSYKPSDEILKARAKACLGDAYTGLEEYAKALACFEEAAAVVDNMYAAGYLLKAGVVAEKLGDNSKALSLYETIKDQYPTSIEAYEIDKYIGRVEAK